MTFSKQVVRNEAQLQLLLEEVIRLDAEERSNSNASVTCVGDWCGEANGVAGEAQTQVDTDSCDCKKRPRHYTGGVTKKVRTFNHPATPDSLRRNPKRVEKGV